MKNIDKQIHQLQSISENPLYTSAIRGWLLGKNDIIAFICSMCTQGCLSNHNEYLLLHQHIKDKLSEYEYKALTNLVGYFEFDLDASGPIWLSYNTTKIKTDTCYESFNKMDKALYQLYHHLRYEVDIRGTEVKSRWELRRIVRKLERYANKQLTNIDYIGPLDNLSLSKLVNTCTTYDNITLLSLITIGCSDKTENSNGALINLEIEIDKWMEYGSRDWFGSIINLNKK